MSILANADIQAWVCQGQPFTLACADIAPYLANAGFVINSLTIFAHTDVAVVSEDRPAECLGGTQSQCYRVVESKFRVKEILFLRNKTERNFPDILALICISQYMSLLHHTSVDTKSR